MSASSWIVSGHEPRGSSCCMSRVMVACHAVWPAALPMQRPDVTGRHSSKYCHKHADCRSRGQIVLAGQYKDQTASNGDLSKCDLWRLNLLCPSGSCPQRLCSAAVARAITLSWGRPDCAPLETCARRRAPCQRPAGTPAAAASGPRPAAARSWQRTPPLTGTAADGTCHDISLPWTMNHVTDLACARHWRVV